VDVAAMTAEALLVEVMEMIDAAVVAMSVAMTRVLHVQILAGAIVEWITKAVAVVVVEISVEAAVTTVVTGPAPTNVVSMAT